MPKTTDAGPLLSGRVTQVSTMTLDTLIPRMGHVPLESALQRGCNMASTFAHHVEVEEIWLRTVVQYECMNVMCTQLLHTMRHVIPGKGGDRWVLR